MEEKDGIVQPNLLLWLDEIVALMFGGRINTGENVESLLKMQANHGIEIVSMTYLVSIDK